MQPEHPGGRSDGGERQQQTPQSVRTQNSQRKVQTQHKENLVRSRLDQLIYGYLRRSGYNTAANALEQESQHIPPRLVDAENHSTTTVNDRLHDQNLEEIITHFHNYGAVGLNQSVIDIGEDLRRLSNRFDTILSNAGASNRSHVQMQLYGRGAYPRQQQQHVFTTGPAPQALEQMRLQRINQAAALRFNEQQRQQSQQTILNFSEVQQQFSQPLPRPSSENLPPQNQSQPATEPIIEDEETRCSRRKESQPLHLVDRLFNPLATSINDHRTLNSDSQSDFSLSIGYNLANLGVFDPSFIEALDFHPDEIQPDENPGDLVEELGRVLGGNDQQQFADPSLVVEEEIEVETEDGEISDQVFHKTSNAYANPPEPLLSPVRRNTDIRTNQETASKEERASSFSGSFMEKYSIPKKQSIPSVSIDKREEKERRDRKSGESARSSRHSTPPKARGSEDAKRNKDRERDKERSNDKSINRERDKRKDSHPNTSSSSSKHHQLSEAKHSSHVQSDRESTSSSSSRQPVSERKEEKERKRKEREQREIELHREEKERKRKEKEQKEAEQQRVKEKDRFKNPVGSSSASSKQQQGNDMLAKVRHSHASGGRQSDLNPLNRTFESTGSKRKAEEPDLQYKIPKKSSSSTLFNKPFIEPAPSSKASKSGSKHSTSSSLSHGDDRPDSTHFLAPVGHTVRISSILLNCDTTYQAFHDGLQQKAALMRKQSSFPSPYYSADETSGPITPSDLPPHPKGRQFAPVKGNSYGKMESKQSTSSSNLSEGTGESSKDVSDDDDGSSSENSRSRSPEVHKPILPNSIDKTLDRLHLPKH